MMFNRSDFRNPHSSVLAQVMENVTINEVDTTGSIAVIKLWAPKRNDKPFVVECITTQDDPMPLDDILNDAFQGGIIQPLVRHYGCHKFGNFSFSSEFAMNSTEEMLRVTEQIIQSIFRHPRYPQFTRFHGGTRQRTFSVSDVHYTPHKMTANVDHSLAQRIDIIPKFSRSSNARLRLMLAKAPHDEIW
eukprot:6707497-Prymnesium_polylepis.2